MADPGNDAGTNQRPAEAPAQAENKAFCAVLGPGGTQRRESGSCRDFADLLPESQLAWIDYVVDDLEQDLIDTATRLGFSELIVRNLMKNPRSGYEDFDTELGLMIPAIFMQGFDVKIEPLFILIRGNIVLTLHTREVKRLFRMRRYAETLMRKIPPALPRTDKLTHLLIRIIDENNSRNFDYLVEIEEHGDQLSRELSDPRTPRSVIGPKIYEMKHALIVYLGGLWGTVDTLSSLRYGDAELLTDDEKILDRINALTGEVQAQIGLAEHLSEVLASGLEVLQSIYNNQLQILNNKLAMLAAYLAIIGTALLVPNTIATVAGNPMFQFGPSEVPWFLGFLVVSTVVATIFTFWVLKKRGLLPGEIE
ncbi:MAG TPA: CorA family divalent cation transporter [Methanomicrobiales archaeon]|nr:CorA family divalent cation transporter [Methanomicrobiales archaeon]